MMELTPKGSRIRAGLAGSIVLHLAVITAAILSLPHWRQPLEPRGIEVSLAPFPPRSVTAPPRPAPPPPSRLAGASPTSGPAPPTLPAAPSATPPSPAEAPEAADGPDARAKLRAVLRGSFGCTEEAFAHLSGRERDHCAEWRQAQTVPGLEIPAPIEHNKRAWFDAIVAARNSPDHGPGGSCFVKPPHGIKLGPLPCYIELPKGPFTEDVDSPPEPEHDPR